ncbi:HAD-IIA family hydrolase [Mycobacterium sp. 852013-50091_SCH5140682]|uniref:HAD-IIA family hydrolase n=1 Tax=Mycobacterium sp. 852013-50091_SCH5140682 TaxID=1834109 RepID=UPI0009ED8853|nr:HAD-IIA family hydrolase [Mycobacterium sp. 852013-50091_SCH5140682]
MRYHRTSRLHNGVRSASPPDAACLAQQHDGLLLDLDGTVFRGSHPTAGAVEVLNSVSSRKVFVTNNASHSPIAVAEHMRGLGVMVETGDIITSGQSAARLLASELPTGSAVLVVGTDALVDEVFRVGLRPVRTFADAPVAVVQGHSPRTCWSDLNEAALAIRNGARWVATNLDATFPTGRGIALGNGSMVAALREGTGATPDLAGKPAPTMLRAILAQGGFRSALVIGDRLDTDIAGATDAGLPSLLVLSGVTDVVGLIQAPPGHRPTYVAEDLRGLLDRPPKLSIVPQRPWRVSVAPDKVTVTSCAKRADEPDLSVIRAITHAVWSTNLPWDTLRIVSADDVAHRALRLWSLID